MHHIGLSRKWPKFVDAGVGALVALCDESEASDELLAAAVKSTAQASRPPPHPQPYFLAIALLRIPSPTFSSPEAWSRGKDSHALNDRSALR